MADEERLKREYNLTGTPRRGMSIATIGFFVSLTVIVFYGVAGPTFQESLGLSGAMLGLLLSSPHITKALLRIPFGAWVDDAGGKKPFLVLLILTCIGIAGLVVLLLVTYPDNFGSHLYPLLLLFGILAGCGGATFSVGIAQTSYWYPSDQQGYAMGVFAGAGNIGPGIANFAMPIAIGAAGLTLAYAGWFAAMVLVTVFYAVYAVDSYYFQLRKDGVNREKAKTVASELGQDVFPAGSTKESLKKSSSNKKTWALVFMYTISFGGGFTALSTWYPTYWNQFHEFSLTIAGLLAGIFVVYGSLIRIPGGSLSDRFGGENVGIVSFAIMAIGGVIVMFSQAFVPAFVGMMVIGTGMGIVNAAIFELVPKYVPEAVGGASGWIGGIGGTGTLVILPVLGVFVDLYGVVGYAWGFVLFAVLSTICVGVMIVLKYTVSEPEGGEGIEDTPVH
ncbi:MFS transporter [Natronorarus salvus]|uniref:MFS transporter n=1 Tax=Natronorarus salvus TaxID=3117733 RepID=UPI002F263717